MDFQRDNSNSQREQHNQRCMSANYRNQPKKFKIGEQNNDEALSIQQQLSEQNKQKALELEQKFQQQQEIFKEQKDELELIQTDNDEVNQKDSLLLKYDDYKLQNIVINTDDLMQEILGNASISNQIKMNMRALIEDLKKSLQMIKNLQKVIDYESAPPPANENIPQFFQILEEFESKSSKLIKCDFVIFCLIDQSTQELLIFNLRDVLRYKIQDFIQGNFENLELRLYASSLNKIDQIVFIDKLLEIIKNKQHLDYNQLKNIQITKFQVQRKQGLAIQINSHNKEGFTQQDHEIILNMSTACLRKLNREREFDFKSKIIYSYSQLLKISINLNVRSSLASLIYEAERKLKELMGVKQVVVILVDHQNKQLVKLNQELVQLEVEANTLNDRDMQSYVMQMSRQYLTPSNQPINIDSHLLYFPISGLAQFAIEQKKTLIITDPLSYKEYNQEIDLQFPNKNKSKPIICLPIIDKEQSKRVEGCIEIEFKKQHYTSQTNIFQSSNQYRLDYITKEILEIFSNQLKTQIRRIRVQNDAKHKIRNANQSIMRLGRAKDSVPKKPYDQRYYNYDDFLMNSMAEGSAIILDDQINLRRNFIEKGEAAYQ